MDSANTVIASEAKQSSVGVMQGFLDENCNKDSNYGKYELCVKQITIILNFFIVAAKLCAPRKLFLFYEVWKVSL